MAFVETVDEGAAEGVVAELYASARESVGYVPNMVRAFSLRPEIYQGWEQLKDAVASSLDTRRYELATLAAARRLGSSYCCLAHGKILAERFLDPAVVAGLAGGADVGLDEADRAVMALAEKVAADARSVTEEDVQRCRDAGLDDGEIVSVVAAAALRSFFSKMLDGLGALPDAAYNELDPALREALTVGRPIQQA